MLDMMQAKHRFMVRALTHRYKRDRADDFLGEMRARIDALRDSTRRPRALAAIVVTRNEPVVIAETNGMSKAFATLNVQIAAVIVNASGGNDAKSTRRSRLTGSRAQRRRRKG